MNTCIPPSFSRGFLRKTINDVLNERKMDSTSLKKLVDIIKLPGAQDPEADLYYSAIDEFTEKYSRASKEYVTMDWNTTPRKRITELQKIMNDAIINISKLRKDESPGYKAGKEKHLKALETIENIRTAYYNKIGEPVKDSQYTDLQMESNDLLEGVSTAPCGPTDIRFQRSVTCNREGKAIHSCGPKAGKIKESQPTQLSIDAILAEEILAQEIAKRFYNANEITLYRGTVEAETKDSDVSSWTLSEAIAEAFAEEAAMGGYARILGKGTSGKPIVKKEEIGIDRIISFPPFTYTSPFGGAANEEEVIVAKPRSLDDA